MTCAGIERQKAIQIYVSSYTHNHSFVFLIVSFTDTTPRSRNILSIDFPSVSDLLGNGLIPSLIQNSLSSPPERVSQFARHESVLGEA